MVSLLVCVLLKEYSILYGILAKLYKMLSKKVKLEKNAEGYLNKHHLRTSVWMGSLLSIVHTVHVQDLRCI